MDEFALIREYFAGLTTANAGVALGIGDDCALLQPPPGHELAVTADTLVAGRHFPEGTRPYDIGWKSLAVNLSDLAAMGAEPRWFLLSLTLPQAQPEWLREFAAGLKALADGAGIALVGGDTTRGPLAIAITAIGVLPQGLALRRSGAQVGDVVAVTGTLGDAALALWRTHGIALSGLEVAAPAGRDDALDQRLDRPTPRLIAGRALRGLAHAAIDISDGLAGDLGHILAASGVGADISLERLPMSPAFARLAPDAARRALQLGGGDDYELCVCLPESALAAAQAASDVPLTAIGRIAAGKGLRFLDESGVVMDLPRHGYRHFT